MLLILRCKFAISIFDLTYFIMLLKNHEIHLFSHKNCFFLSKPGKTFYPVYARAISHHFSRNTKLSYRLRLFNFEDILVSNHYMLFILNKWMYERTDIQTDGHTERADGWTNERIDGRTKEKRRNGGKNKWTTELTNIKNIFSLDGLTLNNLL